MKFLKKYPTRFLATVVKNYWLMEILPADLPYSQLYFPYGSFELIYYALNPGLMQYVGSEAAFCQPSLFYSGQFTRPFFLDFNKPCKCFGISFKPWAGNLLYRVSSQNFTNQMIPLEELNKNNGLLQSLHALEDEDQVFNLLEEYVLKTIGITRIDEVSMHIAQSVIKNSARRDTNAILSNIGLSRRRIEQRFLASTGLTIGAFTNKIRFQKAISLLSNNTGKLNLTRLGYDAGYYDQSHFISEFKKYTSLAPFTFSKQTTALKDFISSLTSTQSM